MLVSWLVHDVFKLDIDHELTVWITVVVLFAFGCQLLVWSGLIE